MLKMILAHKVAKMYGLEAQTTINFYRYCDLVTLWKAYKEYLMIKRMFKGELKDDEWFE